MTGFSRRGTLVLLLLLGTLGMLGPIGHDLFIPSIPLIAEGLHSTTSLVSASISAIFAGSAIGTLFHGPLADRFGRKPVILCILGVYSLTSIGAAFATNIETLIVFRFLQGIALSGGRVLSATVARDLFDKERLAKMLADIMFVASLSPILAPIIGGYLAKYMPWQTSLFIMAIFGGIIFLFFSSVFEESSKVRRSEALRLTDLWRNLRVTVANQAFLAHSLCGGLILTGLVIFLSVSAGILIQSYGISPETYGFMFASVSCFYLTGTFLGARLVTGLGVTVMIGLGIGIGFAGSLIMLVLALMGLMNPYALIIPMGIYMFGLGFVNPNTVAGALQPFPDIAGAASSITNFIRGVMAATISFGVTFLNHENGLMLAIATFILSGLALFVYYVGIRGIHQTDQ